MEISPKSKTFHTAPHPVAVNCLWDKEEVLFLGNTMAKVVGPDCVSLCQYCMHSLGATLRYTGKKIVWDTWKAYGEVTLTVCALSHTPDNSKSSQNGCMT